MKTIALLLSVILSTSLIAAAPKPVVAPAVVKPEPFYRAGEFNLDLYGTGSIGNADRDSDHVRTGLGLGGTYFLTKGLGIGIRADSENAAHSVFDRCNGRVVFRAPLWDRISPYGYVEGGFDFELDRWGGGAGGGLEYRFYKNVGLFGEAGLSVDTEGIGKMRGAAGLRLSF